MKDVTSSHLCIEELGKKAFVWELTPHAHVARLAPHPEITGALWRGSRSTFLTEIVQFRPNAYIITKAEMLAKQSACACGTNTFCLGLALCRTCAATLLGQMFSLVKPVEGQ